MRPGREMGVVDIFRQACYNGGGGLSQIPCCRAGSAVDYERAIKMDVFVIHSGQDKDIVAQKLAELHKAAHGFNALLMPSGNESVKGSQSDQGDQPVATEQGKQEAMPKQADAKLTAQPKKKFEIPFWKIEAKRKIKKAQMVIFFVGQGSHESENIDWEIRTAMKHKKPIYAVLLQEGNKINDVLEVTDSYTGKKKPYCEMRTFEQLMIQIRDFEDGDYNVFNQDINELDKAVLFEQYKVFLQTSEDLVSRRQNVNNFYISINSALMAAFGIVFALDIASVYKFFTVLLLSVVGIILSVSWIKILTSYGDLNSSKMKIINHIEKQLPASLYKAEWEALSDKLNKRKYVSFTKSEKRVPTLFIVVYICVSVCGIAFLL